MPELSEERTFVDATGVTVFYDVYLPTGPARAAVLLLHGMGEHAGRYVALATALADAGFAVYADDHRGHGRTGMAQHGDAANLGRLGKGGMPAAVAGVWEFTQLVRAQHPDLPLVLIGHSWGSMLSQLLFKTHPEAYDAVVLSGSALLTPTTVNGWGFNARWKGPDAMGTEWLSSDLAVGRAYLDDPLTTTASAFTLFGPIGAMRLYGLPRRDIGRDVPVLLMVGRDDPVGGPRSVHKLADAYRKRSGLTDVTTLVYPGARHEIFNEVMQEDVRADLLAWLDARFPAR